MKPRLRYVLVIVILLIAFSIRFFPHFFNYLNLGIPFIGPDPYYHARRILLTAQHFPHLPTFDYYLSYPTGAYCIWPPLFDFLCGTIAFAIGLGSPSIGLIEFIAALYPIFFVFLVLILTYLIGKEIFNEYAGITAAAIVAILPASTRISDFGYTDHHIAEAFSLLLMCYFTLKAKDDLKSFLWLGLSIGIGLLFWQGSIVFAGIVCLYLFVARMRYKYAFVSFLISIAMIFPFSIGSKYIGGYFTHIGLSYLYICLLGLACSILLLKYFVDNKKVLFVATGVIVVAFILLLLPQLKTAINFVTKNEWTKTIIELQPLFLKSGYIETIAINSIYGRFYYLWPVAIILVAIDREVKKRFYFIYFAILIGFLNFVVIKYSAWFSPFYALMLAYFLYLVYNIMNRVRGKLNLLKFAVIGVILFVIFQPVFATFSFKFGTLPPPETYASFEWLRDSTETTSYFAEPTKQPEYGVISFWHYGHFIIYISRRPAVVTNFGADAPNFDISNEFILSQTEEEANQILRDYNVRYIYYDYSPGYIRYAARYLDRDVREYFYVYHTKMEMGVPGSAMFLKDKGIRTFYYRLNRFYGCGVYFQDSIYIEPIRHSRLVYASSTQFIKIFEFVKGATIKGKINPYAPVILEVPVNLPNIHFVWSDSLLSDEYGNFLTTCPYSTDTSLARLIVKNDTIPTTILEESVLNGDTLIIPLPPKRQ